MISIKIRFLIVCVSHLIFLSFVCKTDLTAQVQVKTGEQIWSEVLNENVNYSVILPEKHLSISHTYPVVYLLHGYGGDNNSWLKSGKIIGVIDSLETLGELEPSIYILPDAKNSYFINNYDGSFNYADFFLEEFIPFIDSTYPSNKKRALIGLSMGGYGSVVLALHAPESFIGIVAISAAVRNEKIFIGLPQGRYESYFGNVYGPGLQSVERITDHWKKNSPYHIIGSANSEKFASLSWYIACGSSDPLLPANKALHEHFMNNNIMHVYRITSGKHDWNFWHSSSIKGLLFLNYELH